jgi:hypothetical protein
MTVPVHSQHSPVVSVKALNRASCVADLAACRVFFHVKRMVHGLEHVLTLRRLVTKDAPHVAHVLTIS